MRNENGHRMRNENGHRMRNENGRKMRNENGYRMRNENSFILVLSSAILLMSGVVFSSWIIHDKRNLCDEELKFPEIEMRLSTRDFSFDGMWAQSADDELILVNDNVILDVDKAFLGIKEFPSIIKEIYFTKEELYLSGEDVTLIDKELYLSVKRKISIDEGMGISEVAINSMSLQLCYSYLSVDSSIPEINTAHLDRLFEEIILNNEKVGIIHIYSEYPDYKWVGDDDEGIACVDDASRAAVFYLRNYSYTKNEASLDKAILLLKFLINMQADNGYFYNFIWPDHSIHKGGVTTKAEPNWWSWRTLWTYGEALEILDGNDDLVARIRVSRERLIRALLNVSSDTNIQDSMTQIRIPEWIGSMTGADQAALIMMGLSLWHQDSGDEILERLMRLLSLGVMSMQVGDQTTFARGAFLSWKNLWHAYGNSQAYALFGVGKALNDTSMIHAALQEAVYFYPALMAKGGSSHFWVRSKDTGAEIYEEAKFPQIAYNYRPMIWACLDSWKVTGDELFLKRAHKIGSWYSGSNPARQMMYNPKTGRTFDGIISEEEINRNSGAESTIEALLALQELKRFPLGGESPLEKR
jgi:hypothetical protein